MSNKIKMSHNKKKTMARKMLSKVECKYGVPIFGSYAWKHRAKTRMLKAKQNNKK